MQILPKKVKTNRDNLRALEKAQELLFRDLVCVHVSHDVSGTFAKMSTANRELVQMFAV